jgi:hypothetical protein
MNEKVFRVCRVQGWKWALTSSLAFAQTIAFADEIVFNFSSPSQWNLREPTTSETWKTGFLNVRDARIQTPVASGGIASKELRLGFGTDGAFNDGPAQTGITVALPTITFNTDVKSTYEFTSFALGTGNTVLVTGSRPLVIRVLGAVTLNGPIIADGQPGEPNGGGGVTTQAGAGGAGGGGGGSGGRSIALTNSTAGGATAPASGGAGGASSATAASVQGGGGGCNGAHGGADDAVNGYGGATAGSCASASTIAAAFESVFSGGAGGGGGGSFTGATPIIGAGGGGGGGAIHIVALDPITVNGGAGISAKGGDGGWAEVNNAPANTSSGAAGGGGSGGSVWLQSIASITGGGGVDVGGGLGGESITFTPNFFGGRGSIGVFRADAADAAYAGPAGSVAAPIYAQVQASAGTEYVVYSQVLDFSTRYIRFLEPQETITTTGACGSNGTLEVRYEGSQDGVNFTKTVPKANISELDDSLFVRVKVSVVPSSTAVTAPCLTALTLRYEARDLANFNLEGGLFCGRIDARGRSGSGPSSGPSSGGASGLVELSLLALAWLIARLRLVRIPLLR